MPISAKTVRSQMAKWAPLFKNLSLDTLRKGQKMVGELLEAKYRQRVFTREHVFEQFKGAWVLPRDERRQGVLLYLHGGGYTCGDLDYAVGYGAMLAVQCGAKVFCPAYRLAPEHPFPAAVEDALTAYRYLLEKGYTGGHITLCGESAGGGLCYALCQKLQALDLPQPCGIIAISPWTDLTLSGASYTQNQTADPAMTIGQLQFFANNYTRDVKNPLVSPLFADLSAMPPSLLFAAENEIMRSDARELHQKLLAAGCKSQLLLKADRWHAYVVYGLAEDQKEWAVINKFLNQQMSPEDKLRWLRLDNAAKIYPAARRPSWSNVFRLSATLTEAVDTAVLQQALDVTVRRFPSIAVRLRKGAFWYYLQQLDCAPQLRQDCSYPLTRMSVRETRRCALRVLTHQNRIAVEFFHSLTDGTGAMVFLKSLLAEYLQQKYGLHIPAEEGVLGRLEEPSDAELEDSFQKYAGKLSVGRQESAAWRMSGTPESGGFLHVTCFKLPVDRALAKAREKGVSLTTFLGAVMMLALQNCQAEQVPNPNRRKPIKLLLPVNLRNLYPSRTLRNFALYTTPEILPRLGQYDFDEICTVIRHRMGLEITPKYMSMRIATNVSSERLMAVRVMPLFIKNIVMRLIFDTVGERASCLSMSNLGAVRLPQEMTPYVARMDFILGVQAAAPYNCGILSYGETLYINFIRNIREPDLERHFAAVLQQMGLTPEVESNRAAK